MFCMTIAFGASPVQWMLLFKTEAAFESAKSAFRMSSPGSAMWLIDDYGQELSINTSSIHGVMFEDMSKSKMAQIERGLHQTRVQIEANNMGKADPAIAAAMRSMQQPPGVITPFGPNGAFRQ